ncbi:MAG: hypothetical protein ACYSTX_06560, partial [Planctomycetota bacterium]
MKGQKKNEKAPAQKKRKKWWLWLLLTIFIVIIALIALLPAIISSEMARKTILAKINDAAPGHLDFTDLSIGWLKGVSISDINYQDDLASIKVKVKQFAAKPHFGSIIFGNISFGDTIIDEPIISIDLKEIP